LARKTAQTMKRAGAAAQVAARINLQMKRPVIRMASDPKYIIEKVPTGSLVLDRLTGGGFARGRHVELYGDWTVGKSLIAYMTMILAQERGEVCAVLDPERVFNSAWFAELGGDIDSLLMPDFQNASEVGSLLRLMEQNEEDIPGVDIVLIDSVASLLTSEEQKYDWESDKDVRTASLARYMSLLLRQITMSNDKTLFIWTNQWRDKISSIPGLKSTPGGRALGFYASTRIELMQGEKETEVQSQAYKGKMSDRKVVTGRWVNVRLAKEKTGGRPEETAALMLDYDTRRLDITREILDLGLRDGLIEKQGDYYSIPTVEEPQVMKRYHGLKRAINAIAEEELQEFLVTCITEQTALLASGDDG
jgi:recombination protein RecA